MYKNHFIQLYDYNYWANLRVWDCAMKTSDEDYFKDNDFSVGSVYTQLFHTMAVEDWWLGFLLTGEVKFLQDTDYEIYKDREKFRQKWDEINTRNMTYIKAVTDDELRREVKVHWWEDSDPSITVAQALTQVANHSTDHRAQAMAVLHMLGYEGIGQDFLSYLHRESDETT